VPGQKRIERLIYSPICSLEMQREAVHPQFALLRGPFNRVVGPEGKAGRLVVCQAATICSKVARGHGGGNECRFVALEEGRRRSAMRWMGQGGDGGRGSWRRGGRGRGRGAQDREQEEEAGNHWARRRRGRYSTCNEGQKHKCRAVDVCSFICVGRSIVELGGADCEKAQGDQGGKLASVHERHRDEYTSSGSVESECKSGVDWCVPQRWNQQLEMWGRARTRPLTAASPNGLLRTKKGNQINVPRKLAVCPPAKPLKHLILFFFPL